MAKEQEQWRGAVEARLPSTPAAAAWLHVADFFSLHKYLPGIDVCEREKPDGDDVPLQPGCVRYCAALAPGGGGGAGAGEPEKVATWAREELVELDPSARRLGYAVVGSNMGFGRYVAFMTVLDDGDAADAGGAAAGESGGSRLVWAFECDPVEGWSRDGLLAYLDGGVRSIAARIEEEEAAAAAAAAGAVPVAAAAGGGGGGAVAA